MQRSLEEAVIGHPSGGVGSSSSGTTCCYLPKVSNLRRLLALLWDPALGYAIEQEAGLFGEAGGVCRKVAPIKNIVRACFCEHLLCVSHGGLLLLGRLSAATGVCKLVYS